MDSRTNKQINNFIKEVSQKYSSLEQVYLFGSFAKETQTENSDIDLALFFNGLKDENRFDLQVHLLLYASKFDTRIEAQVFSVDDLEDDNPLINEIRKSILISNIKNITYKPNNPSSRI
jgi:predicted nucleotidyltransferase